MTEVTSAAATPHPWSKDALLAKAQRYAQVMSSHSGDDWEYALWSTFVLEFVARAALANVSPTLLADIKDWNHLYYALGFDPKASKYAPKSAHIKIVLERLSNIVSTFTPELESFCIRHMGRRNEELHSGATPFDGLGSSTWLPSFYQACDLLLSSMAEKLDILINQKEVIVAKALIAAAKDESAKSVGKTIAHHKNAWLGKTEADRETLSSQAAVWAMKTEGHRVKCPACNSAALVVGVGIVAPKKTLDGNTIVEKQTYLPARFECAACGLKIAGFSQLNACGLGDSYTATRAYDAAEYYAPEPEDFYEPDFNEP